MSAGKAQVISTLVMEDSVYQQGQRVLSIQVSRRVRGDGLSRLCARLLPTMTRA
jgi:hypothetical protein